MAHDTPTYASVPGIRVFGMMCVEPTDEVNNAYRIQRPIPPKRNQYHQTQTSYYNRYKKHTMSKLSAQQKTNENGSNLSTQSSDSADFTTRGISIIPGKLESREEEEEQQEEESNGISGEGGEEEVPSSTFDTFSSSFSTTLSSVTDSIPTESATDTSSRKKRHTDTADTSAIYESSSRNKRNDWPDIPWDEISQQIKNIQWDN